jgi:hypothetical protein
MPQQYDPLSQEDDSHIHLSEIHENDSPRAGLLPRPAVYYGEGPFDVPSSDDEDEGQDEVTGKYASASLNRAESGRLSGLHLGGQKVCNP